MLLQVSGASASIHLEKMKRRRWIRKYHRRAPSRAVFELPVRTGFAQARYYAPKRSDSVDHKVPQ